MDLFPSADETIEGVGLALAERRRTCGEVLASCLARIEEWEPRVRAWVVVDPSGAWEQARRLDEELAGGGRPRGPLHGIPVGIKDIIDVAGLPTACGSRLWADRIAPRDAPLVAQLRRAGAVILGKTVTTQYAWIDPAGTRNPWDLGRTPGGSSSGSAAGVACGMCLGAVGTQTGGSIIRPASFCGVAGYKPAHGHVATEGVLPFAPSLDHPGPIARTVVDLAILYEAIAAKGFGLSRHFGPGDVALPEALRSGLGSMRPPVLGVPRRLFEAQAGAEMRHALDQALDRLERAGATVQDVPLPPDFGDVLRAHRVIMAAEAAAEHERRLAEHPEEYLPRITALLREGLATPAPEYVRRRAEQARWTRLMNDLLHRQGLDALVTPATLGPPPDLSTTGDPVFNAPWSLTGMPALSFPIGLSPDGLPLAMQLVGGHHRERLLFQVALWCEEVVPGRSDSRRD